MKCFLQPLATTDLGMTFNGDLPGEGQGWSAVLTLVVEGEDVLLHVVLRESAQDWIWQQPLCTIQMIPWVIILSLNETFWDLCQILHEMRVFAAFWDLCQILHEMRVFGVSDVKSNPMAKESWCHVKWYLQFCLLNKLSCFGSFKLNPITYGQKSFSSAPSLHHLHCACSGKLSSRLPGRCPRKVERPQHSPWTQCPGEKTNNT